MNSASSAELTEKIVEKAKSLGADLVGAASVESLKKSPSHRIYPKIGMNLSVHWQDTKDDAKRNEVTWPSNARSVVVIGVEHNADKPELDWWDGKGTPFYCVKYCRECELVCPVGKQPPLPPAIFI